MTDEQLPASAPAPAPSSTSAASWIRDAWAQVQKDLPLWVGMAVLYFAFAIALKRIPFLGNLVLILLTPLPFAGALLAARDTLTARKVRIPEKPLARIEFFAGRPLAAMGRALQDTDQVLRLMLACILTLGVAMVVGMIEYLLTGGSLVSGLAGARYVDAPLRPRALIGGAVVIVFYALLVMALHFLVARIVFHKRDAVSAITESFNLWRHNARRLVLFTAPFLLPVIVISLAFSTSATHWLGYLLLFTLGAVALPVFIVGSYCAYVAIAEPPPAG